MAPSSADQLEITHIAAENLKDLSVLSEMACYAVLDISSEPRCTRRRTSVDNGHTNFAWHGPLLFPISAGATAKERSAVLNIAIYHRRFLWKSVVGRAEIRLADLQRAGGTICLPVRRPSGRTQGAVTLSYKFVNEGGSDATWWLRRVVLEGGLIGGLVGGGLVALAMTKGNSSLLAGWRTALEPLLHMCEEISPLAGMVARAINAVIRNDPQAA